MDARHVDVLLVGGGVASARCARTLRRQGFTGTILLVSDEETPPYNRPPLSKELLREDLPTELTLAEPMSWYERRGVELMLSTRVAAIDPEARRSTLADGSQVRFGQLLLATGAEPRRPALPGAEHASLLRTLPDADRAARGGGGRDAGRGHRRRVHRGRGRILPGRPRPDRDRGRGGRRAVGGRAGRAAERLGARAVERRRRRRAAQRHLRVRHGRWRATGRGAACRPTWWWPVSGSCPGSTWRPAAGLDVDDGVLVDEGQRTSAAGILAAGDMARPRDGVRIEHWHAAREAANARRWRCWTSRSRRDARPGSSARSPASRWTSSARPRRGTRSSRCQAFRLRHRRARGTARRH